MNFSEMLVAAKAEPGKSFSCDAWKNSQGQNYLQVREFTQSVGVDDTLVKVPKLVIYTSNTTWEGKDAQGNRIRVAYRIHEDNETLFGLNMKSLNDEWYAYDPASL